MKLVDQIDLKKLPVHVAVIMDGNGRWAKKHGKKRIFGHRNAIKAVRETTEGSAELGIPYLTLYAFSTENWNRPKREINALMHLLVSTLKSERESLNKNGIKLNAIGDIESLPSNTHKELMSTINATFENTRMTLTLALSYSSRWEMTRAAREMALAVKEGRLDPNKIDDKVYQSYLNTTDMPDPELLIRTSGETRLSNFLLWQMAYTELYFTKKLWPDFRKADLYKAIINFQQRERRFGKTTEQIHA